ncbi:MAG: cation:proton antiporter [Limisphaerales bacterium]
MSAPQLSVLFFIQMFVILAACRLVGLVARRIGQPQVVGEMVAGVLLGPSLFGLLAPGLHQELFPPESLKVLFVVAQLGIGLYMFLVGAGFDTAMFRSRLKSAAAVSVAGILAPLVLGALLMPWLMQVPGLFGAKVRPHEAALFLGAALAVTAFPMLARILEECGLARTALGTLCLAAGALSDAAAWGMLILVQASFGGDADLAVKVIVGGLVCGALILTMGRWLLARLGAAQAGERPTLPVVLGSLGLLTFGAWAADAVGIHAVFGGFLLGLAMPRGGLTQELKRKLEPLTVALLLPVFFAYSGLNTRLDMVNSVELLGLALVVLAASCVGKFGACWAAARFTGEDNRTALAIGALMNARGLMELIILNIGLQLGIIQPPLFSMLVLMAVVTTLMATPLVEFVHGGQVKTAKDEG